ncbi:hypothetical protein BJ742DRAFT_314219 [Cladochytrium replicatum]|nr:hypothetical protein BJ742DRAFT_314219 [Cladochytrium replicatum]
MKDTFFKKVFIFGIWIFECVVTSHFFSERCGLVGSTVVGYIFHSRFCFVWEQRHFPRMDFQMSLLFFLFLSVRDLCDGLLLVMVSSHHLLYALLKNALRSRITFGSTSFFWDGERRKTGGVPLFLFHCKTLLLFPSFFFIDHPVYIFLLVLFFSIPSHFSSFSHCPNSDDDVKQIQCFPPRTCLWSNQFIASSEKF